MCLFIYFKCTVCLLNTFNVFIIAESITYVEYTWPRLGSSNWFSVCLLIRHIALSNVSNANGYRVAAELGLHVNPPVKQINSSYLQYATTVWRERERERERERR